ncbi:MAG: TRAP transporter large permease [Bacillota bacterium]|jgi:C4-dicarboxylate transporter DctM subunit
MLGLSLGVVGLMLLMLVIGFPIAVALLVSGVVGISLATGWDAALGVLQTVPFRTVASYVMTTCPMFILMAEFASTGLTQDLFDFAARRTKRFPASLGVATVIANAIMGAICGSSTAAAATMGRIAIPEMTRKHYPVHMACGIVAVSGTLSILIPPSVVLVLYGIMSNTSVGKLLMAGIIPGIMSAVMYSIIVVIWFKREQCRQNIPSNEVLANLAQETKDAYGSSFKEFLAIFPVILLMLLILGGIYSGIVTPTEAASVGALATLILGLIRRDQSPKKAYDACIRAVKTNAMIFTIMIGAKVFGYFLTLTQATIGITNWLQSAQIPPWSVLLILIVFYLILGCMMDGISILLLTVPVVAPIVASLGFDLIWFGIIMTKLIEVGLVTPPVGINCYIVADSAKVPVATAFKGIGWLLLGEAVILLLLILFPQITLFIPSFMSA